MSQRMSERSGALNEIKECGGGKVASDATEQAFGHTSKMMSLWRADSMQFQLMIRIECRHSIDSPSLSLTSNYLYDSRSSFFLLAPPLSSSFFLFPPISSFSLNSHHLGFIWYVLLNDIAPLLAEMVWNRR